MIVVMKKKHQKRYHRPKKISLVNPFNEGKEEKVCFNFRKGRCRFGSKCTYAHDSDVKQKPTTNEEPLSKKEAFLNTAPSTEEHEDNPDAVIENNKKPKKRPGLSQGLTPSKKAMKFHEKVYNNS